MTLHQVAKLVGLQCHGSRGYKESMKGNLELLLGKVLIGLQASLIIMPPRTCDLLQLVSGETHFILFHTLDESEILLNSSKPMISRHRILPTSEDWWVGLHKTMVSTRLLHSRLVGIHQLYHIDHPSHHVVLCFAMGFISMEQLLQGRYSVRWWWR